MLHRGWTPGHSPRLSRWVLQGTWEVENVGEEAPAWLSQEPGPQGSTRHREECKLASCARPPLPV